MASAEPPGGRATQGTNTCVLRTVCPEVGGELTQRPWQLEMRAQRLSDLGGFLLQEEMALGKFLAFLWLPELVKRLLRLFKLCYSKDPRLCGTDKLTKAEEQELEIGQHLLGQPKTKSRRSEKNPQKA